MFMSPEVTVAATEPPVRPRASIRPLRSIPTPAVMSIEPASVTFFLPRTTSLPRFIVFTLPPASMVIAPPPAAGALPP